MDAAVDPRGACAVYRRRRPERTPLYRTVQGHLETYLALAQEAQGEDVPAYVEREFRRYLECGILAHGFARARCGECGHDFLIAFSCKGRGVCPSCNARRMVETAAHLVDQVFPPLPVRQWVLAVPKRLRYLRPRPLRPGAPATQLAHDPPSPWSGSSRSLTTSSSSVFPSPSPMAARNCG
jgi:hypothetical protein